MSDITAENERIENENKDQLKTLIARQIAKSFRLEYQAQAAEEQGLGLLIAHYFEWDGLAILKTFFYALEDANFHKESKTIQGMINDLEKEEVKP